MLPLLVAGNMLLPRALLERRLASRLSRGEYIFQARYSGRVALLELASAIKMTSAAQVALVPDYVCNIVPRAVAEAGWNVELYPTDDLLEADWSALAQRIALGDVGLLVGASVFGSSGLLDDMRLDQSVALLRRHRVHFIADIAQDVGLVDHLPAGGSDVVSAIVSFNDKSFPGAMGGGILASRRFGAPLVRAGGQQRKLLAKRTLITWLRPALAIMGKAARRNGHGSALEYSQCDTYPFRLTDNFRPEKLQLAMAMAGMTQLSRRRRRKASLLALGLHKQTRFASTAAYLLMDGVRSDAVAASQRRRKLPYALEGQPAESLRPADTVLFNRGFADDDIRAAGAQAGSA